jgi:diacylglycerol kinase
MDITHPEYTVQARSVPGLNILIALRKIFSGDPGLKLQLFLVIPIVAGGVVLHMNFIQWILISFVTLLCIVAGIFRTAALLQINHDPSLTHFQVTRIKCMGNAMVTITAGLSLITYLMVFVPKITALL